MKLETTIRHRSWAENDTTKAEHARLSTTHSEFDHEGELNGTATADGVIAYLTETTGSYCGYEIFTGRWSDAEGSFVVHVDGEFTATVVTATMTVLPDSGTAGLTGVHGSAKLVFPLGAEHGTVTWLLER